MIGLLLAIGCRAHLGHDEAELRYVGAWLDAADGSCGQEIVVSRERSSLIVTTDPGIQEAEVRIEGCGHRLDMTLDCRFPSRRRGYRCDAHGMPALARADRPNGRGLELLALQEALTAAGCGSRTARFELVGQRGSAEGIDTTWTVSACRGTWTAMTTCRGTRCALGTFAPMPP